MDNLSDIVSGLGVIKAIGPGIWVAPGGATTSNRKLAAYWARYIHRCMVDAAGEDEDN